MAQLIGPFIPAILGFRPTGDIGGITIYTDKRGNIVAYPKAPPKEPPTYYQTRQRNRFRLCGRLWNLLEPSERHQWNTVANRSGAAIAGYTLFVWYQTMHDHAAIATLQRQTHTTLPL